MCGICGIIQLDRSQRVEEAELISMRDMMAHRGPDDAGLYIDGQVGLAHRRLSIIDLSAGHQPMSNEDGSIWVVYNGEIYNFRSLRDDLIKAGHTFRTQCDTEVLVHLYEDYGTDFLQRLYGMFSFAIWDSHRHTLFAARDRLGIKPFYYLETHDRFLFASEIKAILACEGVRREINYNRVYEHLIFRFISGHDTLFKGIKSLLPGSSLVLKEGKLTNFHYWKLNLDNEIHSMSKDSALERLHLLFQQSVKRRLISDVPLGTLNSGGIDSSLVTAYASEMKSEHLNTYSVGFDHKDYDESAYASMVADQYGTAHHTLTASGMDFARILPLAIWYNDEPLNHANSVLILQICRLAKERVTVLLTGEGADEVFAGYPRYWLPFFSEYLPSWLRKTMIPLLSAVPGHYSSKLKNFLPMTVQECLLLNSSFLTPKLVKELVDNAVSDSSFAFREACVRKANDTDNDIARRSMRLDVSTYLLSILQRMDRMSMATGVEARVPFLDHELVEFSYSLPSRWKLDPLTFNTKSILKTIARRKLSDQIVFRKKSGFGVPLDHWMKERDNLGRFLYMLKEERSLERGLFQPKIVCTMVDDQITGKYNHSEALWELINLEIWFRIFIDQLSSENIAKDFFLNMQPTLDVSSASAALNCRK